MKSENILIAGNQVKLADFDLTRDINSLPPFTDYVQQDGIAHLN